MAVACLMLSPAPAQAAVGDLLVADEPIGTGIEGAGSLLHVDPSDGTRSALWTDATPWTPLTGAMALEDDGDVLLAWWDHFAYGDVFELDRATGETGPIGSPNPSGPSFYAPRDLAVEDNGDVLVSDGAVYRIDRATGNRTIVSSNTAPAGAPTFSSPQGIAVEDDGEILVVDMGAFGGGGEGVIRVDPTTGARTAVSSNTSPAGAPDFADPQDLVINEIGDLVVVDSSAFGGGGGLIRVDPTTGARTVVSSNGSPPGGPDFVEPVGVDLEADGDLVVADANAFGGDGGVIRVDLATGARTAVSSNASPAGPPSFGAPLSVAVERRPVRPVLTDTDPDSPGNDNQPEVKGSAEAGSTVRLYTGSDCSGAPVASGSAAQFASPGFTATVPDDATTDFRATATDPAGNDSACSDPITYVEDSVPPPAPSITDTDPEPPANDDQPEVKGTAAAGSTVRLYTTADCGGAPVGSGSTAQFAFPGITATVPDNSTSELRATATDSAGNTSSCSDPFTYVEDSQPPLVTITDTDPDSPANDNEPEIKGTAEAGSTVRLYSFSCSGGSLGSASAAQFASPGITGTQGHNSTRNYYVTATDAAGNTSPCSDPITYVDDSDPPSGPSITDTDPDSPANDNQPEVKGIAEPGSTVRLYTTADCSGAPVASGSAAQFASPGLAITVPDDSSTTFRGTTTDVAGNTSFCRTSSVTYVEDSRPPSAALAASPNPALTDETVRFDASASSGLDIARFEWDLDGDGSFETDTGADPTASRSYPDPVEIVPAVRVTNRHGASDVAREPLSIRPRPPSGNTGISINDGAQYTDDPEVTLDVVWPPLANRMLIANDGGFDGSTEQPVAEEVPWRLDSSGPERLPRIVYARFLGSSDVSSSQTFTDDIILDETRPKIRSAAATGGPDGSTRPNAAKDPMAKRAKRNYRLRIKARDKVSGVQMMQVTKRKSKPGTWHRFKRRSKFKAVGPKIFVRVADRAGNRSKWERADFHG